MADSHLPAAGGGSDFVRGAEGQRLNRHGRLSAPGGHKAASVAEEEVGNIVGAVMGVHERALTRIPKSRGPLGRREFCSSARQRRQFGLNDLAQEREALLRNSGFKSVPALS